MKNEKPAVERKPATQSNAKPEDNTFYTYDFKGAIRKRVSAPPQQQTEKKK